MTPTQRTAWLAQRQTGLGGTDMAAIAGVGFLTPAEVYAEKVSPTPIDRPPSPLMRMGLATEDVNADLYRERTGARLVAPGLIRSPADPWMLATLDRAAVDTPERVGRPVELKYVGAFFGDEWGDDGSDQVRDGHAIQATWQMTAMRASGHAVTEADISALSGTGDHRVYTIPFNRLLSELLVELGAEFWRRVTTRAGVDGWRSPLCDDVAARLAAIRPDTAVALGEDARVLAEAYQLARANEKHAKSEAERFKAELVALLGTNETGRLPDGGTVRQRVTHRKAYSVEACNYVDFRILKPKKGK